MKEDKKNRVGKTKSVLAYTGVGFQMLATILVFMYAGIKLDEQVGDESKTWTLVLLIIGIFVAFYFMIKGFLKLKG